MRPLRFVGGDVALTAEQGRKIKSEVVFAARRRAVGRRLFTSMPEPLGIGYEEFGYDTMSEVSEASLGFVWPGAGNKDIINLARTTVNIPILKKEAEINKIKLAASQQRGTPLRTSNIVSQAYRVARLEDDLIIDGYSADGTTYEINGVYQAAGNSYAVASDWAVVANIITSINGIIALLLADEYWYPFNLTINSAQFVELLPLIGSTNVSYFDWVKKALNGPNNEGGNRGQILMSNAIAAGTGLVSVVDHLGEFDYIRAEELTTYLTILQESENLFARVYLRALPVVYNANSLGQLTSI